MSASVLVIACRERTKRMITRSLSRHGRVHPSFDSISNTLSGFAELIDGPVGAMFLQGNYRGVPG